MVPSKNEEVIYKHDSDIRATARAKKEEIERRERAERGEPEEPEEPVERLRSVDRYEESVSRERTPIIPTESDENVTTTYESISNENAVVASTSNTQG